jgi:hypothetical protein
MKRIIEVKRGDPVPDGAKWLKDVQVVVGSHKEYEDDGITAGYTDVPDYATFDVFEYTPPSKGEFPC